MSIRKTLKAGLAGVSLLCSSIAWSDTAPLLWEDLSRMGGATAESWHVATDGKRVLSGAQISDCFFPFDCSGSPALSWGTRSLDARTGNLLWQDDFSGNSNDNNGQIAAISMKGRRAFIAGDMGFCEDWPYCENGENDWVIRALDSRTGQLLWQQRTSQGGDFNRASSVLGEGNQVFAGGFASQRNCMIYPFCEDTSTGSGIVRAYDEATGHVLWEDAFQVGSGFNAIDALAMDAGQLFAAGHGQVCIDGEACHERKTLGVLRAYEAGTGDLLWSDAFDAGEGLNYFSAVAAGARRVYASGHGQVCDTLNRCQRLWVVRAYDAISGELIWQDQHGYGGDWNEATQLVLQGNQLIVGGTGSLCDEPPTCSEPNTVDAVIRVYDAKNGKLEWENHFHDDGHYTDLWSLGVRGNTIFAAGSANVCIEPEHCDGNQTVGWIGAYDAKQGKKLWRELVGDRPGSAILTNLAVGGRGVFAVGGSLSCEALGECTNPEALVRAYSTNKRATDPGHPAIAWVQNHSRADEVHASYAAHDVVFSWDHEGEPHSLFFGEDIVSVGVTENGTVIEFSCPEVNTETADFKLNAEVIIGKVAGSLGEGSKEVLARNLFFAFWGEIPTQSGLVVLTKDEAARVPLLGANGGLRLVMPVQPVTDADFAYQGYVTGMIGAAEGQSDRQQAMLDFVEIALPGLVVPGTEISWLIDLKDATEGSTTHNEHH